MKGNSMMTLRTAAIVALGAILGLGALAQGGTPYAWGKDEAGQLGAGVPLQRRLPVQVADSAALAQLAAGFSFSMGLKADVAKGVPTTFRFLDPDGGEATIVWQY